MHNNQHTKAKAKKMNRTAVVITASILTASILIGIHGKMVENDIERLTPAASAGEIHTTTPELSVQEQVWNLLAATDLTIQDRAKGMAVVDCESTWDQYAIGDNGKSHGLWQIHEPSHPKVSRACKFDVECSTQEAVKIFHQSGNSWRQWTCGR